MSNARILVASCMFVLVLALTPGSLAAPPGNDGFADATVITSMPFVASVDITEATFEPGEPHGGSIYPQRSVWFSFTPAANAVVRIGYVAQPPPDPSVPPTLCDLRLSSFLLVYRAAGAGFAGLSPIDQAGSYTLQAQAGTTYYIQAGETLDSYGIPISSCPSTVNLRVSVVAPPPNDDFAHAIAFTSVPFSDSQDMTAATVEPGEPLGCGGNLTQSAWYAFTPAVSGSYGSLYPSVNQLNVYIGSSLGNLTVVDCSDSYGAFFWGNAGTSYYLQYYGMTMGIRAVAPPDADFRYSPERATVFQDVSFSYWNGGFWDPTVNGWTWAFGDGTTATGSTVSHAFVRDGDYDVTLTVHARGGRSSTQTHTVQISSPPTPFAPRAVAAVPANGRVIVTFDPPLYEGASPVTYYTATASPGGHDATASGSPIIFTGLAYGTSYTFTVTACNAAGPGPPSATSNAVVPEQTRARLVPPAGQPRTSVPDPPAPQPRPQVPPIELPLAPLSVPVLPGAREPASSVALDAGRGSRNPTFPAARVTRREARSASLRAQTLTSARAGAGRFPKIRGVRLVSTEPFASGRRMSSRYVTAWRVRQCALE